MTNPELVLMDEPSDSEGLAPLILQEISRIIGELNKSGLSILLVEQNLSMALALADDVYIISKGETVYHSSSQQLRQNREAQAMYLGATGLDFHQKVGMLNGNGR
jgi:branched-chain amino acid transport system ATP-binding protein